MLSTTHQITPQTLTQPWVVNVHHDDNHEHVQLFDEIVSTQQPWRSTTPSYCLPKTNAPKPITTSIGFQNQPPTPIFWYLLIRQWNNFNYSTSWINSITLNEDPLTNQFRYHI